MAEQTTTTPEMIHQSVTENAIAEAVATIYPNLLVSLRDDFVKLLASAQAEQQPKQPRQSWSQSETLTEWYKAMADAQKDVDHAEKDGRNTYSNYNYASAEEVIRTAKEALSAHGLGLFRLTYGYTVPTQIEHAVLGLRDVYRAVTRWRVFHVSGQWLEIETTWPFMEEKGRPIDKAYAAALTESLAYFLRDLVQIPRGAGEKIDGDVSGRDDSGYDPRQGNGRGDRDQRGRDPRGGDPRGGGQSGRDPRNDQGDRGQGRDKGNERERTQGDQARGNGRSPDKGSSDPKISEEKGGNSRDPNAGAKPKGTEDASHAPTGEGAVTPDDAPTIEQYLSMVNSEKGLELTEGQELAGKISKVNHAQGEVAALALLNSKLARLKAMDPKSIQHKAGESRYDMVKGVADALVKNSILTQEKASSFLTALSAERKDWDFKHGKSR